MTSSTNSDISYKCQACGCGRRKTESIKTIKRENLAFIE